MEAMAEVAMAVAMAEAAMAVETVVVMAVETAEAAMVEAMAEAVKAVVMAAEAMAEVAMAEAMAEAAMAVETVVVTVVETAVGMAAAMAAEAMAEAMAEAAKAVETVLLTAVEMALEVRAEATAIEYLACAEVRTPLTVCVPRSTMKAEAMVEETRAVEGTAEEEMVESVMVAIEVALMGMEARAGVVKEGGVKVAEERGGLVFTSDAAAENSRV